MNGVHVGSKPFVPVKNQVKQRFKTDGLVKNLKSAWTVIPAQAGIQSFQMVMDSGFRQSDGY